MSDDYFDDDTDDLPATTGDAVPDSGDRKSEIEDMMALPKEVEHWSLTTLREKLVKIGAKGVKRISIGGAMMRAVIGTLVRGSRQMLDEGRFDWGADMMPTPEINELFSKWQR